MPQSQRVKQIVMISCNGWMGQLKPLAENLVPWSLSDLVQHYNNCFSEGDLPFSYGEIVLLSRAHPSMLIASGQKKKKKRQQCLRRPCWKMRADLPYAIPAFSALRPIYSAMAMSCRDLPSILCVDVETASSRPLMVTAWGELSWHKEYWSASLAFGARCLLISGCWSNASSGVGVEKGIWAVKSRMGKRVRPGCSSVPYRIFLQHKP